MTRARSAIAWHRDRRVVGVSTSGTRGSGASADPKTAVSRRDIHETLRKSSRPLLLARIAASTATGPKRELSLVDSMS